MGRLAAARGTAGWTLLSLLLAAVSYRFVDRPFSTLANSWHHPAVAVDLTYLADVPLPASVLVVLVAFFRRLPRPVVTAAVATLAALAMKGELKFVFGRPWPDTWIHDNPSWIRNHVFGFFPFHGGAGYASFPSGHTTAITAPSAVWWRAAPRFRPVAAILVAAVACGLLVSDYHFVSDVIAGLALGVAVAHLVASLSEVSVARGGTSRRRDVHDQG